LYVEFNVHQAKTQFSKLLDLAQEGEEVVIVRNGKPVAELVPARKKGALMLGAARGTLLTKADDWWKPMREQDLAEWYGR
jgi:prevent-host-death family protein